MAEYLKDAEKQQFRDELAMRLMVVWAAQHTQPVVQPTDSGLEALRAEGKMLGKAALSVSEGFMEARSEHATRSG
jgi:hypothetical protein